MKFTRCAMMAMLGAALLVSGCKSTKIEEKHHPAKLEESGEKGIMKVILEAKAAGVKRPTLVPPAGRGRTATA